MDRVAQLTADGDETLWADFLDRKVDASLVTSAGFANYNTCATCVHNATTASLPACTPATCKFWGMAPTLPSVNILSEPYTALLRKSTRDENQGWRLFAPFELSLWLAIIGLILVFGLGMALLTIMGRTLEGQSLRLRTIATVTVRSQYDALSSFLGGEDHEWMVQMRKSRHTHASREP